MTLQKYIQTDQQNNDALWEHKWGFADTEFVIDNDRSVILTGNRYPLSGLKLPGFLPYMEESFGVEIDWDNPQQEVKEKPVSPCRRNEAFHAALAKKFPPRCFSDQDGERLRHSHGQTSSEEVWSVLYDRLDRAVDLVFYCESEADAQTLIQLAVQHNVCLVPYGGGTNVSSALLLPLQDNRMIVAVDTRRMNQVEWIDRDNYRACVQAGITGQQLDAVLRKEGFTSGHEPDSRELSTLGGWIATNASGMKKNRYGNIEDIVETITMVTSTGLLTQQSAFPRVSMGMPVQRLFFGSEGNLGLITKAIIRICPLPEIQKYNSLVFPNFSQGVAFLNKLAQTNFVPASIRLYDNTQFRFSQEALKTQNKGLATWVDRLKKFYAFKVLGLSPQNIVVATIVMEGSSKEVAYQKKAIYTLAKKYDGLVAGALNAQRGYMLTYALAYIGQFLMAFNILGETFETTVSWSNIQPLCEKVIAEIDFQHRQFNLPGKPYLNYRVTQIYPTGVCLYFSLALYMKGVDDAVGIFSQIYAALRQRVIECGGSISHHHGVGKTRKMFMETQMSPASIQLLQNLKEVSDPLNIFGIRNNVFGLDKS